MSDDFDKTANRLHELRLEIWNGFVYVTLHPEPGPLAPLLVDVENLIANYRIDQCVPFHRETWVWDVNWKAMIENFMDPLHVFRVHAKTIEPVLPTKKGKVLDGGPLHSAYVQFRSGEASFEVKQPRQLNPALTEEERTKYPVFCVYPGHLVGVSPDRIVWMSVQPEALDRTTITWGIDTVPGLMDGGNAPDPQEIRDTFDLINEEDKGIVVQVTKNARSQFARAGRLATKEQPIWEFQKFLLSRLG